MVSQKKSRCRVRFKAGARVRKVSGQPKGALPKAPTRLAGDNGANLKIKIRRKQ